MRGFYGIGILQPNSETNCGTLLRSAFSFGANFVYTVGRKYSKQCSDTCKTPLHIPLFFYEDFGQLLKQRPKHSKIVGVELSKKAITLPQFYHPECAIYLLGNEGYGIPQCILDKCDYVVEIPSIRPVCLNVATAGTVLMYSRLHQMYKNY